MRIYRKTLTASRHCFVADLYQPVSAYSAQTGIFLTHSMEAIMGESMNAGEICNRVVVFATEDMTLKEAADLMRTEHVGSLVVVREADIGRIVIGMLTDRDIAIVAMAREFDPQTLRVGDIMSTDLVTAREEDSINDILSMMRVHGVRRVPVTSENGVLIGIVTLDDMLDILAEEMRGFVQAIKGAQKHERRVRV
ncbi:CBS domain-containing protein [Paucimonas lemoignei]|nr:CBS domain-containing protein [Paucimonas lemoignei]